MSESRAFANYSNTTRQLQSGAEQQQQGRTVEDTLNDAANFEQQFLIGMAVHQKAKVGDQLQKAFKGSKKLQDATGLSEDDLSSIAKGDFSGVTTKIAKATSEKLKQSISNLADAKATSLQAKIEATAKDQLSKIKQGVSDRLNSAKDAAEDAKGVAQDASSAADAEVSRLRGLSQGKSDEMRQTAQGLRDASDADQAAADAAVKDRDAISKTRPSADSTEDDVRLESNPDYDAAANDAIDKQRIADDSTARASSAEDAAGAQAGLEGQINDAGLKSVQAAQDLAAKTAAAESAGQDAAEGATAASAAGVGAEGAALEAATAGEKVEAAASDVSKIKDVAEGALAESEFDPVGLLVAGIGALAATLIGRNVKTHEAVDITPARIQSSYSSTLGA